jgi:hypothetical protein
MDGGGRLDQPLMRSRPIAAEAIGAPVDEPSSPRAENRLHRNLINRGLPRLGAGGLSPLLPPAPVADRSCCLPSRSAMARVLPAAASWPAAIVSALGRRLRATKRQCGRSSHRRVSLSGRKEVSREEILTTAGVTGRASLLFLDADAARTRLMANPWIADAAVLKLYPDRLQITVTERQAFALWQKDGRVSVIAADGTVLEPLRRGPLPRSAARRRARRRNRQANDFLAVLGRYPDIRAQLRASVLVAERRWNLRLKTASTCVCRNQCRAGARLLTQARSRQAAFVARYRRRRSCACRSRERAALRRGGAGARRSAQRQEEEKGGDA